MSKSEKDHIDPLFRKAAANHSIEFNENDWLNMKKRLDEEEQRMAAARRSRRMRYLALTAGALLLISVYVTVRLVRTTEPSAQHIDNTEKVIAEDSIAQGEERPSNTTAAEQQTLRQQQLSSSATAEKSGGVEDSAAGERIPAQQARKPDGHDVEPRDSKHETSKQPRAPSSTLVEKPISTKDDAAGDRSPTQGAETSVAKGIEQQAYTRQQQQQQVSSFTSKEKSARATDSVAGERVAMQQVQRSDPEGAGQRSSTQQQVLSFTPGEKSAGLNDSTTGERVTIQQAQIPDTDEAEQRRSKQHPVLSSASGGKSIDRTDSTTDERVATQTRASEDRQSIGASAASIAQRPSGTTQDQKKEDTIIQQVPSEKRNREAVSPSPSASDENPILAHQSSRSGDVLLNSGDEEPRTRSGEPSFREPVSDPERGAALTPDTVNNSQSSGSRGNTATQPASYGSNQPVGHQPTQQGDSLAATHPLVDSVSEKPVSRNEDKEEPKEEEKTFYRLSISLAVAPDFSMIGLDRYTTPGESAGLVLQYHFSKKVSLGAGVLRSTKKYWGYGSEYNCPTGYWKNNTNGIIPETIDGVCTVLEFPLMVRYNLAGSGKYTVFVSAGASSYVLLDESYRYSFETANPGAKESWSSSRNEKYFFNMGQISAGYERFIRPNLAVGIEPYFKIPFMGMGWTDISLYSTGAYVTLRYRFLKKQGWE